jgi:hypothetical protein
MFNQVNVLLKVSAYPNKKHKQQQHGIVEYDNLYTLVIRIRTKRLPPYTAKKRGRTSETFAPIKNML